ncbi:MAG: nucleotidyltransferase, partial [Bacteroidetes bacterium]
MKNVIIERIYDFLKNFPPFHVLSKNDLMVIAKNVKVIYVENDQYIFKQNDKSHDHFYIVNEGAIGLYREEFQDLVDKCDEGDIFGLRSLIIKDDYSLSAKAIEESIVYSISSNLLEEIITRNTEANKFLIASFATNIRNPYSKKNKGKLFANIDILQKNDSDFTEIQSADYSKNPITCGLDTSIKEAAKTMTSKRVGSIIITNNSKPLGIITDKDLRTKIATGQFNIDHKVSEIMSSPVITYPEKITIAEAQIAMLQHKVTHLCITKDGTPNTELVGLLSEHDIIVVRGNNPSVLLKEIKRAKNVEDLKFINDKTQHLLKVYIEQKLPIFFVSKIISTINKTIT